MTDLATIYEKYKGYVGGGDKGTAHSYIDIYSQILDPTKSLLEVGVYRGESLAMFSEYFTGWVVGLDINTELLKYDVLAIKCDATDNEQVARALGVWRFDYIIDDGSHRLEDQVKTLSILWDYLQPGGTYIIEDIEGDNAIALLYSLATELGQAKLYDLREVKGRYDDVLITITKGG